MIWSDMLCRATCWNDDDKTIEVVQSPKIEYKIFQHRWLGNDCLLNDIILPYITNFEVDDIVTNFRLAEEFQNIVLQRQAINPTGEPNSGYEVVLGIAKKLGKYDDVSDGKDTEELSKSYFSELGTPKYNSWKMSLFYILRDFHNVIKTIRENEIDFILSTNN